MPRGIPKGKTKAERYAAQLARQREWERKNRHRIAPRKRRAFAKWSAKRKPKPRTDAAILRRLRGVTDAIVQAHDLGRGPRLTYMFNGELHREDFRSAEQVIRDYERERKATR